MRLGANPNVRWVIVVNHVHPIAIVSGLLPTLGFLAGFKVLFERFALH